MYEVLGVCVGGGGGILRFIIFAWNEDEELKYL